jgi:hypothetical protein
MKIRSGVTATPSDPSRQVQDSPAPSRPVQNHEKIFLVATAQTVAVDGSQSSPDRSPRNRRRELPNLADGRFLRFDRSGSDSRWTEPSDWTPAQKRRPPRRSDPHERQRLEPLLCLRPRWSPGSGNRRTTRPSARSNPGFRRPLHRDVDQVARGSATQTPSRSPGTLQVRTGRHRRPSTRSSLRPRRAGRSQSRLPGGPLGSNVGGNRADVVRRVEARLRGAVAAASPTRTAQAATTRARPPARA